MPPPDGTRFLCRVSRETTMRIFLCQYPSIGFFPKGVILFMAKIKPSRATAKETVSTFPGLGARQIPSRSCAQEVRNFRILADGSLEKRAGWFVKHELPGTVRAFWRGTLDGEETSLVLCGDVVYRIDQNGEKTPAGLLSNHAGRARIFRFGDALYLQDGSGLLVWDGDTASFVAAEPYAPLYGYNWHPTAYGDVLEEPNLLSPRLRVHYFNSTGSASFRLPFSASSIDGVITDGISTSAYSLGADGVTLTVTGAEARSTVEVAFTRKYPSSLFSVISKARESFVDRTVGEETLYLFGAPQGYRLFPSYPVSESMYNSCRAFYQKTSPLYFREEDLLNLGSTDAPITAMCRQYDRLLAFHRDGAWSLLWDKEEKKLDPIPILCGIGCMSADALAVFENDVLVFGKGGLYRLHSLVSHPDDFSVKRLSSEVEGLLNPAQMQDVLLQVLPAEGEIRIRDAASTDGLLWVRSTEEERWYCFDNIHADLLLTLDHAPAFSAQGKICVFDPSLSTDDGSPITAVYQSGYLSFDSPETVKRSLRASLSACTQGDSVNLLLETEQLSSAFLLRGKEGTSPELFDLRALLGRFRFLRFRLSTSGVRRSRFFGVRFFSKC